MMWITVTALLLATPALGHYLDIYQQEPEYMVHENTHEIRRPSHEIPCPDRAVCGVAYDFNRLVNGENIPERRIIFNCKCPGGTECPIAPEHRVFSSIRRREYLCNPLTTLVECGTIERPAKEIVEGSEEFNYNPYVRVNCLCPRHTNPRMPKSRREMALATRMLRIRYDWGRHMAFHHRICI